MVKSLCSLKMWGCTWLRQEDFEVGGLRLGVCLVTPHIRPDILSAKNTTEEGLVARLKAMAPARALAFA